MSDKANEQPGMRDARKQFGNTNIPPPPIEMLQETSTRYMITRIVLENFKSFRGVNVIGPFNKAMTAIVGPTATGKRNILDSILFVFGYSANKFRTKKTSDLLHVTESHQNIQNCSATIHFAKIKDKAMTAIVGPTATGKRNILDSILFVFGYSANKFRTKKTSDLLHVTESHQNIQNCSATIHFAKIKDKAGDEEEVVPNSEIIISRKAFRDNTSEYMLNGRKVQFEEVAKSLCDCGIDLDHSQFLMVQDRVEEISMMKPKGLEPESGILEHIESIIGTWRFKESLQKLTELDEQLTVEAAEKFKKVTKAQQEIDKLQDLMKQASWEMRRDNNPGEENTVEMATLSENLAEVILKQDQDEMAEKPAVSEEYEEKKKICSQWMLELDECTGKHSEVKKNLQMMQKNRYIEFMQGFSAIAYKTKEAYQMIVPGGDAVLEWVDKRDPFTEGINFSVRPPKKTWILVSKLSNDEKILASLALMFACFYYKPAPLIIMDKFDVHLDFNSCFILGHYIKKFIKNAQIITISGNSNLFERADRLIGLIKPQDFTRTFTINPRNPCT